MLRLQFATTISKDFIHHKIKIKRKFNSDWFPFRWLVVTRTSHTYKCRSPRFEVRLFTPPISIILVWRLWRRKLWSFSLLWQNRARLNRFCHDNFCYASIVFSRSRSKLCNFRFSCCNNVRQNLLWGPLTAGLVGLSHTRAWHVVGSSPSASFNTEIEITNLINFLKPSCRFLFSILHSRPFTYQRTSIKINQKYHK